MAKLFLLLLLSVALMSCGYQLRGLQNGDVELAISSVYLTGGEQDAALLALLRQRLQQFGVSEVAGNSLADVRLNIGAIAQSRRVLSVNASAKVSEFELHYSVSYSLAVPEGEAKQRNTSARRDITFDENQVLAKAEEEQRLYQDMRSDAVNTILRVLQRVKLAP
ncbi:MAG: hypothetical protein COB94_007070 [Gammaproteobacteria bacterium]|nr:hypothetical protein [Gammaproteobacteria bacterium]